MTVRWGLRALVASVLALLLVPATASAEDPPLLNWPTLAPALSAGYVPGSADACIRGDIRCVDAAIRQMDRDFRKLARGCDHDAVFALGYLRTTEEYRRANLEPGFFQDPAFLNHYDVVFAQYFFDATTSWRRGDVGATPPAWRVAFGAAADRQLDAGGNFLLGMNAHINRDLAFVLEDIGLTFPDGSSRKPDHNAVNGFLNRVGDALTPEVAHRFDPTFDDSSSQGGPLYGLSVMQVIQAWREAAWRNAELLTHAPATLRPAVAQAIELGAEMLARQLRDATAYGAGESSAARDAWCAAHWDDWPSESVPDDGGSDLAFDGPDLSAGAARMTASQLALLGIRITVSIERGVQVSL